MANKGALALMDDAEVIERISSGEIMKNIASEYGVKKQSLRERLMKHPNYKQAIIEQAESIVEDATAECMEADSDPTMPVIARKRLKLEAAHKWAAARDPERWGQKANASINIDLGSALQLLSERIQERSQTASERSLTLNSSDQPEK